jgi:hypothetical protein
MPAIVFGHVTAERFVDVGGAEHEEAALSPGGPHQQLAQQIPVHHARSRLNVLQRHWDRHQSGAVSVSYVGVRVCLCVRACVRAKARGGGGMRIRFSVVEPPWTLNWGFLSDTCAKVCMNADTIGSMVLLTWCAPT